MVFFGRYICLFNNFDQNINQFSYCVGHTKFVQFDKTVVYVHARNWWWFETKLASIGGSKRDAPPSWGPNSFIFIPFSAKKIAKYSHFGSWRPLRKILDPPLASSVVYLVKHQTLKSQVLVSIPREFCLAVDFGLSIEWKLISLCGTTQGADPGFSGGRGF